MQFSVPVNLIVKANTQQEASNFALNRLSDWFLEDDQNEDLSFKNGALLSYSKIQTPEFRGGKASDEFLPIDDFKRYIRSGMFTDNDGFGELATENLISTIKVLPSMFMLMKMPEWATHVVWYNK